MKKKIIASIMAAVTLMTSVGTLAGCKKESSREPQSNVISNQMQSEGEMEIVEEKNSKIRLMSTSLPETEYESYGVSPLADSAHVLQATVTPEYIADFIKIDWTVEFQNPNSEWAQGKQVSDYVKITPESDGAHTATVECLQVFGEVIVVKASARGNEAIYGACTCNYILRYDSIFARLEDGTEVYFEKDRTTSFSLESTILGKGELTFESATGGVGTKNDSVYELSMRIDDRLVNSFEEAGLTLKSTKVTYLFDFTADEFSTKELSAQTWLYLPGADASILGVKQSILIHQGYLWATTGTNDDGILSQAEWETYEKYRQAVLSAWMGSENFLITLALTQYDKVIGGNVLQTYEAQVDFVAEILPSIGIGNIELDYGNIDF